MELRREGAMHIFAVTVTAGTRAPLEAHSPPLPHSGGLRGPGVRYPRASL